VEEVVQLVEVEVHLVVEVEVLVDLLVEFFLLVELMTFFLEQEGVHLYWISFLLQVRDWSLRGSLTPLLNLPLAVPFLSEVSPALALAQ
jgi:hypothetical protein